MRLPNSTTSRICIISRSLTSGRPIFKFSRIDVAKRWSFCNMTEVLPESISVISPVYSTKPRMALIIDDFPHPLRPCMTSGLPGEASAVTGANLPATVLGTRFVNFKTTSSCESWFGTPSSRICCKYGARESARFIKVVTCENAANVNGSPS